MSTLTSTERMIAILTVKNSSLTLDELAKLYSKSADSNLQHYQTKEALRLCRKQNLIMEKDGRISLNPIDIRQ